MVINDKLNINTKDILSIVIAAAATAVCVVIDIILNEEQK